MTITQQKETKEIQIGKEDMKVSLFADGMTLYIENKKYTTKKLSELINEFSKVVGRKSIHRNLLHFCTLAMDCQQENLMK